MSLSSQRSMTGAEWATLFAMALFWGGSFFFQAVAIKELPVLTVVTCRVVLAALALWLFIGLSAVKVPMTPHVWTAFFAMGFLNNALPFSLIVWGQQHIASSLASILNASTPLSTILLAHVLTDDEKITRGKLAGIVFGLIGVVVLVGHDAFRALGAQVAAQLACLAATISYACAGIFGRRFKRMGVDPVATAAGQVTASSILLLPLALLVDRPWTLATPSASAIGSLIALAVISTALGYVLYFRLLASAGATNLLLVTLLVPVSALLLGTLVLGESLAPNQIVGMAMIGLGLATIDGRIWRMRRGARTADA